MTAAGFVVDADGRPVEGAAVSVVWASRPVPEMAVRTDRNGAFRIALTPGHYTLRAVSRDGWSGEVPVEGGAQDFTIRLDTPPTGDSL